LAFACRVKKRLADLQEEAASRLRELNGLSVFASSANEARIESYVRVEARKRLSYDKLEQEVVHAWMIEERNAKQRKAKRHGQAAGDSSDAGVPPRAPLRRSVSAHSMRNAGAVGAAVGSSNPSADPVRPSTTASGASTGSAKPDPGPPPLGPLLSPSKVPRAIGTAPATGGVAPSKHRARGASIISYSEFRKTRQGASAHPEQHWHGSSSPYVNPDTGFVDPALIEQRASHAIEEETSRQLDAEADGDDGGEALHKSPAEEEEEEERQSPGFAHMSSIAGGAAGADAMFALRTRALGKAGSQPLKLKPVRDSASARTRLRSHSFASQPAQKRLVELHAVSKMEERAWQKPGTAPAGSTRHAAPATASAPSSSTSGGGAAAAASSAHLGGSGSVVSLADAASDQSTLLAGSRPRSKHSSDDVDENSQRIQQRIFVRAASRHAVRSRQASDAPQDVWESLEMPFSHRMDFLIKYSDSRLALQLDSALTAWENSASIVLLRERLCATMRQLVQGPLESDDEVLSADDASALAAMDCFEPPGPPPLLRVRFATRLPLSPEEAAR
jgi:hypothetical protein